MRDHLNKLERKGNGASLAKRDENDISPVRRVPHLARQQSCRVSRFSVHENCPARKSGRLIADLISHRDTQGEGNRSNGTKDPACLAPIEAATNFGTMKVAIGESRV